MSDWVKALSTYSATREKVLEHRFIADITSELWRRGTFNFAVSHSEVDNSGYDLIIEANGVVRHLQLKAMQSVGARWDFALQRRLGTKPAGAGVLMLHDPVTLAIESYRLFAGLPDQPLPPLGEKVARYTKGDSQGHKAERPALRLVPLSSFVAVPNLRVLVDLLFGTA